MTKPINPWGLTEVEARAMNAMINHGRMKVAADRIGVSHQTLIDQLARARKKIKATNHIQAYIRWYNWEIASD